MKGLIFEILFSSAFQTDSLVVGMSEVQRDGRVLVKSLGGEDHSTRLIPVSDLKNYNSI